MSFKDQHPEMQHLVRELNILRAHNLKPQTPQDQLLLFAEASLVCSVLERFLRILPEVGATDNDTLSNLLEKAFSKKRKVLSLPNFKEQDFLKIIRELRNGIDHSNYEQLASSAGYSSIVDYFQKQFASDIELITRAVNCFMVQIDNDTGLHSPVFDFLINRTPMPPV
jgi:hypothetical protein